MCLGRNRFRTSAREYHFRRGGADRPLTRASPGPYSSPRGRLDFTWRGVRIAVLGAGPAGLLFSLLIKRRRPAWRVDVVEQNPAGATYGFGVVFSEGALAFLER